MKLIAAFILLTMVFAGLSSCKKAYDLTETVNLNSTLNVVNSTSDTLNFYLNGTRQNINSNLYPAGLTGYVSNFITGLQNYQFKKSGHAEVLFTKAITLKDSINHTKVYNTLFITGESADKTFLIEDTARTTVADSAFIRFAHTADGAGALSIALDDKIIFTGQAYPTVSEFKKIALGTGNKILSVYQNGKPVSNPTILISLISGSRYTIYVKGLPGGTGKNVLQAGYFVQ